MSAPPPKPPALPPPKPCAPPPGVSKPAAAPTPAKPPPAPPQTTPVKESTSGVGPAIPPKTTPAGPGVATASGAKLPLSAIAPKPQTTLGPAANAPEKEPTYGVIPNIPPKPGAPPPAQGGSNENKAPARATGDGGGGKSVMGGVGGGQSKMAAVGGDGGASTMTAVLQEPSQGGQSEMGTVRKAQSTGNLTLMVMEREGEEEGETGKRTINPNRNLPGRDTVQPATTFVEIKPHRFFSYETKGIRNVHYQYSKNFDQKQLEMMIDHDKKVVAEDLERKREATKKMMKSNWRRPVWKERLMQTMVFKIIYLMGLGMTLTFMTICLVHMPQSASEEFIGYGRENPTIWDLFMVDLEFDLREGRKNDTGWASASFLLAVCVGLSARLFWKKVEYKAYAVSMLAESRYFHCVALQELRRCDMDANFEMTVKGQVKDKKNPGKNIGK